jgi:hypothetical protein
MKVELRPWFLIGDVIANAGVGALAASAAVWLGLSSWPMAAAMPAGMIVGMLIGLVAALAVLSLLFGAMEIFVPCMLSGMFAGMFGAMGVGQGRSVAAIGAVAGIAVLLLIYAANAALHGAQRLRE